MLFHFLIASVETLAGCISESERKWTLYYDRKKAALTCYTPHARDVAFTRWAALTHALSVVDELLVLHDVADLQLEVGRRHNHVRPWLRVRAAGGSACSINPDSYTPRSRDFQSRKESNMASEQASPFKVTCSQIIQVIVSRMVL